jgi:hypothetical protein
MDEEVLTSGLSWDSRSEEVHIVLLVNIAECEAYLDMDFMMTIY